MLEKIDVLPEDLGRPETLLADNGYFSEANVTLCAREHRAADCARPSAAPSVLARAVCRAAAAGQPNAGRGDRSLTRRGCGYGYAYGGSYACSYCNHTLYPQEAGEFCGYFNEMASRFLQIPAATGYLLICFLFVFSFPACA